MAACEIPAGWMINNKLFMITGQHRQQHLARVLPDVRYRWRYKAEDQERDYELQNLRKEDVERLEDPHADVGQNEPKRRAM